MSSARVLGLVGWSGSGKTTLLTKLIPLLLESRGAGARRSSTPITLSMSINPARIPMSIAKPEPAR